MNLLTDGSVVAELVIEHRIIVRTVYNRSAGNLIGTHYYDHAYIKTNFYCPLCGILGMWVEDGPGDYDAGQSYYCASCGGVGCSIGFWLRGSDTDIQIVEALRVGRPTNIDPSVEYPKRGD